MAPIPVDPRFKSDRIFNEINKQFVTLKPGETKEYNAHLQRVLSTFIERMKEKDPLFNACYRRIVYVGSYYEGLKVGKPEEYDLNVIINLPIDYKTLNILIASEKPGYVKIKAMSDVLPNLRKQPRWSEYKRPRAAVYQRQRYRKLVMDKWFDKSMYLDQNQFRQWFESVASRVFQSFPTPANNEYILSVDGIKYTLRQKKSGPALTLKINIPNGHNVDVDLVPVLEFLTAPPRPFRSHTKKKNWFAVSKPLQNCSNNHILWRPSFYEREQELLKGSIKQVIRQMKKLRDTQNFKSIASYFIKTLFLRELENQDYSSDFQRLPSTWIFYYMLKKFQESTGKGIIYDFWNPTNNLLVNISQKEMSNINDRLNKIIKDIDKKIQSDEYIIAEYILNKDELAKLKTSMLSSAMTEMRIESASASTSQNNGILSSLWNAYWNISAPNPAIQ
ncbi:uncharacterized protein LOC124299225 isoform X1 [Neodiprion virginianus]|uniref:uncharacterized protein LOC124299225 isoform X1 n=2 Tax=Neodiprion virginianus TaxID=2961670 RepID=UPI001EE6C4A8|nr:uncharacterized protein LOC124299225 isoform X1 [Neodiprion virginianus]